ncbi:MAG: YbjQ family protein [Myxococcota bacterium]
MDPGLINIVFLLVSLLVAFAIGEWIERRHYKSIRARELECKDLPTVTLERLPVPEGWAYQSAGMMTGHVVISVDYFKRFVAGLRQLFGGRMRTYETLMDRARREAILRLKKKAQDQGYHAIVNLRIESSRLASSTRKGKGTAGVEVLAFGTGVRMEKVQA